MRCNINNEVDRDYLGLGIIGYLVGSIHLVEQSQLVGSRLSSEYTLISSEHLIQLQFQPTDRVTHYTGIKYLDFRDEILPNQGRKLYFPV